MQQYHNTIQRENQSVQSFFAYIAELKQDLNNLSDEGFHIPFLQMKLQTNIQLELNKTQHQPWTIAELREQATLIESILERWMKPTNSINKALDKNKKCVISIFQEQGVSQQDHKEKSLSTKKHSTKPLPKMSKEKHKWWINKRLCLQCS